MRQCAFTLIELLIVVAIIGVLAAIAVPNFLQAQTRAKVARVYSDHRSVSTALNAYYMDHNNYAPDAWTTGRGQDNFFLNTIYQLTTPIAYMSSLNLPDTFFTRPKGAGGEPLIPGLDTVSYRYFALGMVPSWGSVTNNDYKAAILASHGPDRENNDGEWGVLPGNQSGVSSRRNAAFLYDPTNGVVSKGDIVRGVGELQRIANE